MGLQDLPPELLMTLPQYLHNIQDFIDASSSCRELHSTFARTSPNVILRLAAASSRTFFRPDPHFLIAATIRQVSDWALLTNNNYEDLREAFKGGIEALFDLCISRAGLTLEDIRRLYASRFTVINPQVDLIDRCAGAQWYNQSNFWSGGVSDAASISAEPERALFQIVIYSELFASSMRAAIDPKASQLRFDLGMRLDFIRYCIPRFFNADQEALRHILCCRRWCEAWDHVRHSIGPDFEEEWRQRLWHSAVEMQGLEGLEMLNGPEGIEKWRPWLEDIMEKIEVLDKRYKPREYLFGSWGDIASDAPCMFGEVVMCYGSR
ncbi:hypothetical protein MMC28_006744 [Mycoblastus sanguinarius]|nr:hypothetical protein [Mycoblastus sanguinarius]